MCVNIVRLQDYLLPPDEVVLFDWLLVKQCYVFHHKSFYYSQRRVEKETRIGRRRFETIVQKFKEQGWLWSEVAPSGTRRSAVRRYLVFYDAIARILPKLVRYDTGTYALYKSYLAKMLQMSKAVGAKSTDRLPADVEMEVIALKDRLQAVCEWRGTIMRSLRGGCPEIRGWWPNSPSEKACRAICENSLRNIRQIRSNVLLWPTAIRC